MTDYSKAFRNTSAPYHAEAVRLSSQFTTDATVTDGIVRWNSNGRVPPTDVLDFWAYLGYEFAYWGSVNAQKADLDDFLSDYRALPRLAPASKSST